MSLEKIGEFQVDQQPFSSTGGLQQLETPCHRSAVSLSWRYYYHSNNHTKVTVL